MRKFVFSIDKEEAAEQFVQAKGINFGMVPNCIGANATFWVRLVELDPNYIARVPQDVLELGYFAENVSHEIFYRYLPKRYLTAEDYASFKANPEKAISVNRNPAQVSRTNDYTWYCIDEVRNTWRRESSLNKETLLYLIQEGKHVDINPELWSQEFADYVWKSPKAMVAFSYIPDEYVREEWRQLMDLFEKKRRPVFGYARSMEKCEEIPKYWGSYKTEREMLMALECEQLVNRTQNPYGYAVTLEFNSEMADMDFSKIFTDLWTAIRDVAEGNREVVRRMYELYGMWFSKCMPKELFDLKWLINSDTFEFYSNRYKKALFARNSAKCKVEELEAEDRIQKRLESLKELIRRYVNLDEKEIDDLIATIV